MAHHSLPEPPPVPPELVAELRAYLRLAHTDDDAALAALLGAAAELCERFTGQLVVARAVVETVSGAREWRRLTHRPVVAIDTVEAVAADGSAAPLTPESYAIDIDGDGVGWVRWSMATDAPRLRVHYLAGVADAWALVPPALRQGVVRLAGHLYAHRDDVDPGTPPPAVTALWRPFRRMRLA